MALTAALALARERDDDYDLLLTLDAAIALGNAGDAERRALGEQSLEIRERLSIETTPAIPLPPRDPAGPPVHHHIGVTSGTL